MDDRMVGGGALQTSLALISRLIARRVTSAVSAMFTLRNAFSSSLLNSLTSGEATGMTVTQGLQHRCAESQGFGSNPRARPTEPVDVVDIHCGNFQFEDITAKAGVAGTSDWCSGVTMADVNGDGFLDIYVCAIANMHGLQGHNELFINKGNGTFTENRLRTV